MKVQIFAVGHSITQGYWDTRGGWVQRLRTYLDEKTLENPEKFYFEVYNLGISGNDTNQIIERFDSEIEQRIDNDSQTIFFYKQELTIQYILLAMMLSEFPRKSSKRIIMS